MTRQPKYKFGDKFTKEEVVTWEGRSHKIKTTHVVVSIMASSETDGFEYKYKLASSFPAAYHSYEFSTDYIYESKLEKLYPIKED
jgi:hypothetical protein